MPLRCVPSLFLLDQLEWWINSQFVLNHSLSIPGISDIFHAKTLRFTQRNVMSVNSYLGSRLPLIQSFLSGLLGSTTTSLSSVPRVPISLLSTFWSVGEGVVPDEIFVPSHARGTRGELLMGALDPDALLGVPPPLILTTLATCPWVALSPKRPTCDTEAFLHASVSRWSALMVMTPFDLGIFIVALAVWMTAINFRRKGLPRIQLYPMLKLVTSNVNISLHLLSPDPQDTSRSMRLMGVDNWPGVTPWKVSCIGVRSAKWRPISMNVFLMMRLSEAQLSIRVLATLCRPIGSLTMNDKFQLDSSISRRSLGPNEMLVSDHFIHLSGSICWAKLISLLSFFPYAFEVMGMLTPNITLISSIWSSLSGRPNDLLFVAALAPWASLTSSFNLEKSCTPPDCCDRTTSGRGVHRPGSTWAILGEARTQSTHISIQYHILKFKYKLLHTRFMYYLYKRLFEAKRRFKRIVQS
jgi:hypothetical protein